MQYRLEKADESYEDALILAEKRRWNAVVSRLYYSCFYIVIALLLKNKIEVHTHDGSRTKFGLHFVKTGLISKKYGKLYSKLFDYRQKGDYGDFFEFDEDLVRPLISDTKDFIDTVKKLI